MIAATPRQQDLLRFIAGYIESNGEAPTFAEMVDGLQVSSKTNISTLLEGLEARGLIQRFPRTKRSLALIGAPPIPRAPDGAPLYMVKLELPG